MKTLMTLSLAWALGLAVPDTPGFAPESTSTEKSTYVVTDHMAMYLGSDNKLRLRFGQVPGSAIVEVLNGPRTLYRDRVDLRKGAHLNLNLTELETGTYQIRVSIGKQFTSKTLVIRNHTEQSFLLS